MAAELCLRTGQADVYNFLDTVDPSVIDFWQAYDELYPLNEYDDEKREFATNCSMLSRFMSLFAASQGVTIEALHDNDFLPKRLRYKIDNTLQSSADMEKTLVSGLRLG